MINKNNKKEVKHYLNKEDLVYVINFQKENHLSSRGKAIEKIIAEHKQFNKNYQEKLINILGKSIAENLKENFKTLEKRTSYSDFNLQVIIEILNAMCLKNNIGKIRNSNEFKSEALEISEKYVKEKIITSRVKKLDE